MYKLCSGIVALGGNGDSLQQYPFTAKSGLGHSHKGYSDCQLKHVALFTPTRVHTTQNG